MHTRGKRVREEFREFLALRREAGLSARRRNFIVNGVVVPGYHGGSIKAMK